MLSARRRWRANWPACARVGRSRATRPSPQCVGSSLAGLRVMVNFPLALSWYAYDAEKKAALELWARELDRILADEEKPATGNVLSFFARA